jgi:hypothetical protein
VFPEFSIFLLLVSQILEFALYSLDGFHLFSALQSEWLAGWFFPADNDLAIRKEDGKSPTRDVCFRLRVSAVFHIWADLPSAHQALYPNNCSLPNLYSPQQTDICPSPPCSSSPSLTMPKSKTEKFWDAMDGIGPSNVAIL